MNKIKYLLIGACVCLMNVQSQTYRVPLKLNSIELFVKIFFYRKPTGFP